MAQLIKDLQYLGLPSAPTGAPSGSYKIYYDTPQRALLYSIDGGGYTGLVGPTGPTLNKTLILGNTTSGTSLQISTGDSIGTSTGTLNITGVTGSITSNSASNTIGGLALPALNATYLVVTINGVIYKVPCYAA